MMDCILFNIGIANFKEDDMIDRHEEVLMGQKTIVVLFDKPFHQPQRVVFMAERFTKGSLAALICDKYKEIYEKKGTSGWWNIWGRDINKHYLHGIIHSGPYWEIVVDIDR